MPMLRNADYRAKMAAFDEEVVRQTGTQSAILGGFAFAALTIVDFRGETAVGLTMAFAISTSLAIALELLAMFVAGVLAFVARACSLREERWTGLQLLSWISYLLGLLAFLSSLALLSWIKIRPAAVPITVISALTAGAILVALFDAWIKATTPRS